MNKEEIKAIKGLKHYLKLPKRWRKETFDNSIEVLDNHITVILELIEKQEKEINKLKSENQIFQRIKNGTTIIFKAKKKYIVEDKINKYYISKDKIIEKIKELEDYMILFTNDKEKFNRYKYSRNILEKLLKENNND